MCYNNLGAKVWIIIIYNKIEGVNIVIGNNGRENPLPNGKYSKENAYFCGNFRLSKPTQTNLRFMTKRLSFFLICLALAFSGLASDATRSFSMRYETGISLGTTGAGIDVSLQPCDFARLRLGMDVLVGFSVPLSFEIAGYANNNLSSQSFEKAQTLMHNLTGFELNNRIQMNGSPTMTTGKLLIDFFPLKSNKNWYVTAGMYVGSRCIGKAINSMQDMPTLVSVGIYNGLYEKIMETDFIETPLYNDFYLDPDVADLLKETIAGYGQLGVYLGDFKEGNPHGKTGQYIMFPDHDGTVSAQALVNAVRPYVGLGHSSYLDKEQRFKLSVDLGAMCWGGSPRIVTHEGIDLCHDLVSVRGKVGQYVRIAQAFKAYPVLSLRCTYCF